MEAQNGAEVRRVHVVYFLSRKGRIEHPHLIRVHHLSRNGIRLRDIKRWLGELRGKEMPESFSWSYKRRYKTGYVWQDLVDDDLITPISDNEYVIKGSEISSTAVKDISYTEEKVPKQEDQKALLYKEENQSHSSETTTTSLYVSTKSSSEIEEEESATFGSETSTLTDDSGKHETDKKPEKIESTLSKKNKRSSNKDKLDNEKIVSTESKVSSSPSSEARDSTKSKSNSSNIFRNLISCGPVETNEKALVTMKNKQNRPLLNMCSNDQMRNVHSAEICKRDRIGGSQRILGNPIWTQQQSSGRKSFDGVNKSELRDQKAPCDANKPVHSPKVPCKLCVKKFKPDKMAEHMESCKGRKSISKADLANAAISAAAACGKQNSFSGYLLTN